MIIVSTPTKQFNTFIKDFQSDDELIKVIVEEVKAGKLAFLPSIGTSIRRFLKNPNVKKSDNRRYQALLALFIHYQNYYADKRGGGINVKLHIERV